MLTLGMCFIFNFVKLSADKEFIQLKYNVFWKETVPNSILPFIFFQMKGMKDS